MRGGLAASVLLVGLSLLPAAASAGGTDDRVRLAHAAAQARALHGQGGAKLESAMARAAEARPPFGLGLRPALRPSTRSADGRVRVVVQARSGQRTAVSEIVRALGGSTEAATGSAVQALVPPTALRRLAARAEVAAVRAPHVLEPSSVAGEGVAAINADAWQDEGLRGAGVKVAVIDFGFAGYRDRQASGDLPASVTTADFCDGQIESAGEVHGSAVAEIVHETAPDAQLYLICVHTHMQLAQAAAYAKQQGVHVVNLSGGFPLAGRGDGTGPSDYPEAVVADLRTNGILWVNAAGNSARNHWSGTFSDPSGDGMHEFVPGDAANGATVPPNSVWCADLKWDSWPTTSQDFDLYLLDSSLAIVGGDASDQNGSQPPTEWACTENTLPTSQPVYVAIGKWNATTTPRFDLYTDTPLEHQVAAGSVIVPASSPHAVAVGAVCWQNGLLESFSSQGPTIDGRVKPDLVAPDRVSSATYGAFNSCSSAGGFAGTSASSPHVAGAAALLKGRTPSLTVAELEAALEAQAVDLGPPGVDNSYGSGRLLLLATAPTLTPGAAPAVGSVSAGVHATIDPKGGAAYAVEYGTTAAYGSSTAWQTAGGYGPRAVTVAVTGLAAGTTYHYRVVATSPFGVATGPHSTFTTTAPLPPAATTGAATSIGTGSATLTGTAKNEATSAWFEYGTTSAYGSTTAAQPLTASITDQAVSAPLGGLEPSTTYHFRLVVANANGTSQGSDATFTTAAPAPSGGGGGGGGAADLALSGSVSPATVPVGGAVTWRLRVDDKTLALVYGVKVEIEVPVGLSVAVAQADRGPGCGVAGALVTCNLDFLSPVATNGNVTLVTTVAAAGEFELRATASFDGTDPSPQDNALTLRAATPTSGPGPTGPTVNPATGVRRTGTARANRLTGTAGPDLLRGLGGNDRLDGRAGNDRLEGGSGHDTLIGGFGLDRLLGGTGNDVIHARDGRRDVINCGPGRDRVLADRLDRLARDCEQRDRR